MTNLEITSAYVGSNQVSKLYLGSEIVWQPTQPVPVYSAMPLTFDIISGGTILWYSQQSNKVVQYKINNGSWTNITASTTTSISVNAGDKVQFKGYNDAYGVASKDPACTTFIGSGSTAATAVFDVYGNIMSLIDGDNFEGLQFTTANTGAFVGLFNYFKNDNTGGTRNTCLQSAHNLILPTNVVENCYRGMFMRCQGLKTAPELPATTLAANCYNRMFNSCSELGVSPALMAEILQNNCYQLMFAYCTKLFAITCNATDISASNCTTNWVMSAGSGSGFFYKNHNMTWRGYPPSNAIPSGWTVYDIIN